MSARRDIEIMEFWKDSNKDRIKQSEIKTKLLLIVGIGIISFFGFKKYAKSVKDEHCLTTQISSIIFDFNTFDIQVEEGLNKNEFKVVNQNSGKVIFQKGQNQKGIKNDYGYRLFDVYFKGKKLFKKGHFITNNWITNDYVLKLTVKNNKIEPKLEITGKNAAYNDYFINEY